MLKKIDNEKGIALITALLVLAVLTMLGLAATLVSSTDVQIAANEKVAMQGQYAGEAGIAKAIVMLNTSTTAGAIHEPTPAVTWSTTPNAAAEAWKRPLAGTIDNGGILVNFSTVVSYRKVTEGDYSGRVAFYNRTAGFSTAPTGSGGWPVLQIVTWGRKNGYQTQKSILELTRNSYNFQVLGGVTSGAGLDLSGSLKIDPNFYDSNGNALTPQPVGSDPNCKNANLASPKPGIFANGTSTGTADQGIKGVITSANGQPSQVPNGAGIPTTPWGAMGLNKNSSDHTIAPDPGVYFDDIFPDGPATYTSGTPTKSNYYSNSCSALTGNGNGILVVHNPKYELPNCPQCGSCTGQCAPAVLSKGGGNATFKGIIIADEVNFQGSGNIDIIGSLISLSTITTSGWNGNGTIAYSCQAIEQFAAGRTNKKLNWRRQSATPP